MSEAAKRPDRSKATRVPLGQRNRLTYNNLEPGWNYRVITDKNDRLRLAQEGGYDFVLSKDKLGDDRVATASPMDSRVSTPVGGGSTGYLMRIKDEWFAEDQASKEAHLKKTEEQIIPDPTQDQYGHGLKDDVPPK